MEHGPSFSMQPFWRYQLSLMPSFSFSMFNSQPILDILFLSYLLDLFIFLYFYDNALSKSAPHFPWPPEWPWYWPPGSSLTSLQFVPHNPCRVISQNAYSQAIPGGGCLPFLATLMSFGCSKPAWISSLSDFPSVSSVPIQMCSPYFQFPLPSVSFSFHSIPWAPKHLSLALLWKTFPDIFLSCQWWFVLSDSSYISVIWFMYFSSTRLNTSQGNGHI